jgi:nucleoside-diphosphate-sugar epimerase
VGDTRPVVLITGASGNIGRSLAEALRDRYRIVGFDRSGSAERGYSVFAADFTDDESLDRAFADMRARYGGRIASVVHLVAYYDFTGERSPLYDSVNIEGTRKLLRHLQDFEVEQFLYSSTMLVHRPGRPGDTIDEETPLDPRWAYPQSKAEAERVIEEEHGGIPYVMLRLAGVYDESSMVPTLAQQMARIYDRSTQSYFYAGNRLVGQSMVHREDMLDAFVRAVDRRGELPPDTAILIGEPEAMGYDALQDDLGYLIHGATSWPTLRVPKPIAAAGVWAQDKLEPIIPDAFDQGEDPFIKPFMVFMADDHYAIDINRARNLLGWEPAHRLKDMLPAMVAELKRDPGGWYKRNKVTPPFWLSEAVGVGECPEELRTEHAAQVRHLHAKTRWAHLSNMALGSWLIVQPPTIGLAEPWLARAEIALGAALILFAALALSWRNQWARWVCAGIGALVAAAPFVLWTASPAAYLADTLIGGLIIALAVGSAPEPGPSPVAAMTGPEL